MQQPVSLFLQSQDVGTNLLHCAQLLGSVEVPGKADLVTDLEASSVVPSIGSVGQHLAPNEGVNTADLSEWNLLGVAEISVWFVLDHTLLPGHRYLEDAM